VSTRVLQILAQLHVYCIGAGICDGTCSGNFGIFGQDSHHSSCQFVTVHLARVFRCFVTGSPVSLSSSVLPSHQID
jgi:hypothetical protein